ncbi:MAG: tRNA lysidine(34) synthetase TilS [Clostridia bacterium]|nr:tRNA lysidine(34) synthetase TilS [Clostridia bacterium]
MESYVLEAVNRFGLISAGDRITVALSGGADSMALLNALISLRERLDITVDAAHLNHGIRGAEADRDMEFVTDYCNSRGIELFCERVDVPAFARENSLSTELAARKLRYEFLEGVARGKVATAHTASDNLETVLFNLTRGASLDGLCGIPPKRDIFIRPLLLCTRGQIEEYCEKKAIPFVTDSTNLSDEYTRNKIRHSVVPVLKEINPAAERAVLKTCGLLREDKELLSRSAEELLFANLTDNGCLLLTELRLLDAALAKRVIKAFIEKCAGGVSLETVHIEAVYNIALSCGRTSLPLNLSAVSENKMLYIIDECENAQKQPEYVVQISETANNFFENGQKVNNLLLKNLLDCDKIIGKLVCRTRQSGDSVRLKNRGCTKLLTRIYSEERIPVHLRDSLPVIADDKGVVWIYGVGVAHRCAVCGKTARIFKIDVFEKGENVK